MSADQTFALLRRGYRFAPERRHGEVAVTRLLGRRAVIVGGRAGAQLFYDESRLERSGALPAPLANTLFGKGAVHGLDDAAHRQRKALFVALLTPEAAADIAERATRQWPDVLALEKRPELFDAAARVHCSAACGWAGVPAGRTYASLAHDLAAMVDGFGSIGPRYLRARRARRRAGRWATALVERIRAGDPDVPPACALRTVARYRDEDGRLLEPHVAAVELLNLLRPAVAVAYFVTFAALALHSHPTLPQTLRQGGEELLESFAHEVRRFYPFVPLLAARARVDFTWHGVRIRRGERVVLDVHGTLRDPQLWQRAEHFEAARFAGTRPDPFTLIPQGGGDAMGHRCPGERVTIELIKTAARLLLRSAYEVADGTLPSNRMPPLPRGPVVLAEVHANGLVSGAANGAARTGRPSHPRRSSLFAWGLRPPSVHRAARPR
jgi:fatty-acid peroxygenase